MAGTWVQPLLRAVATGALDGPTIWAVILDCYRMENPCPVVANVLRGLGLADEVPPPARQDLPGPGDTGEFVVLEE